MNRLLRMVFFFVLAFSSLVALHAPVVAQENPDCLGAEEYVRSVRTLQLVFTETMGDIQAGDVENWSPEELEIGIQASTALTAGLEGVTPPPAAEAVHGSLTESFQIWTDLLNAVQESGVLGALSFLDAFNEVGGTIDANGIAFEETCQVAFIDNDDDGNPEIGAGNQPPAITSAEIDPNAAPGSFQNPVPVGESQNVGGGWEITVVAVRPDDTEAVLAENTFNDPPIAGRQFFVADVMVTNIGSEPAEFDGNFRLRATGLEGDYRAFAPDDRCGVVANEWEEPEIAPGESVTAAICWSIPTQEVEAIRLYDVDAVTEARVYFALATGVAEATPVAGR
ncbi:MAG: hypothetical protein AB7V46_02810 [Thermomicrobiales bacterium]